MTNENDAGHPHIWLDEHLSKHHRQQIALKEIVAQKSGKFQRMQLVDSHQFGMMLLIDGLVQSAQADEAIYHELLVHPALLHHPNPKSVFIMGGGEGSTAREVLRHPSVEKCVMVDIDKDVCDFCKEHLSENKGAFGDPRLTLINDDAKAQLQNYDGQFDVIIGDLCDPLEGGPCFELYTQEFYTTVVLPKLAPHGIFVTQSTAATTNRCSTFKAVHRTLAEVFPKVVPYTQHVPSFCEVWGWNVCFTKADDADVSHEEMGERLAARLPGVELEYFDENTWQGVCALDKRMRRELKQESTVYTMANPVFFYGQGQQGGK